MRGVRIAAHADGCGEGLTARYRDICIRRVYILRMFNRFSALLLISCILGFSRLGSVPRNVQATRSRIGRLPQREQRSYFHDQCN